MKKTLTIEQQLEEAFAKINSVTGEELDQIVNLIEQYGKKETPKIFITARKERRPVSSSNKIAKQFLAINH